ncbi:MAG TPA: PP2C family protein-serine/threonine phosphatase [Candidatus Polarisedimenticolaceae bacterium]|nr:PP2C family protein-serine/threonine phosphatase [Candidatus Polarisedimenticolaceae bacterium]
MSWADNAKYWQTLPRPSLSLFLAGVFALFASFGFITANMGSERPDPLSAAVAAIVYGAFGAAWAFAGSRRVVWLLATLFFAQWVVNIALRSTVARLLTPPRTDAADIPHFSTINGAGALVLIIVAYVLFILFIRREGMRYYSTFAEMRLAREIHMRTVPLITVRHGGFEVYGISWPTGEVGGDLVDFVPKGEGWIAYVADISGHGVPAGTFMAMVKSAARMRLALGGAESFFVDMNAVLAPITAPNMFATAAFLSAGPGAMAFGIAAHLPTLKYSAASGSVDELWHANLPLAMLGEAAYTSAGVTCEPGDVFAIVTDGLTEIVDRRDRELGLPALKAVLQDRAGEPLASIAEALRARALAHGSQRDDQTVFLARRLTA